jgi:hypothetical protein
LNPAFCLEHRVAHISKPHLLVTADRVGFSAVRFGVIASEANE